MFLQPDAAVVDALVAQLQFKKVGVVAHFYMDPEVQGVLSSAGERRGRSSAESPPGSRQGRRRGTAHLHVPCPLQAAVHSRRSAAVPRPTPPAVRRRRSPHPFLTD